MWSLMLACPTTSTFLRGEFLLCTEDQEILVGKKRVFLDQPESIGFHLAQQIFARDLHSYRWPYRQLLLLKIDHHNLPAGFQHLPHQAQILFLFSNVMPRVANEKAIHRAVSEQGIVRGGQKSYDIPELEIPNLTIHVDDHVRADIHRIDATLVS